MKITLSLGTLRYLLATTLPFASLDDALPVVAAIELRGIGGYLLATATDRYVFAVQRAKVSDEETNDGEGFYALVSSKDAKHILSTFKPAKGQDDASITLTVDGSQLRVASAGGAGMFAGADDLAATYTLRDGAYPKIASVLSGWKPGKPGDTFYNPEKLGRFAGIAARHETVRLVPGEKQRATVVLIGADFLGAIMPVDVGGEPDADLLLPGWLDTLNAVPQGQKAA
jgi:hypothetical protein